MTKYCKDISLKMNKSVINKPRNQVIKTNQSYPGQQDLFSKWVGKEKKNISNEMKDGELQSKQTR